MGKQSRLKNPETVPSRYEYPNGSRKLYDRDKVPEGMDSDIWHLALYFEQRGEELGVSVAGRPILYTELSHRINENAILSRARDSTGIDMVSMVEQMIDTYWNSYTDSSYAINDFCNIDSFNFLLQYVLDTIARQELLFKGNRVTQPDIDIKPSRTPKDEIIVNVIMNKKYTEEELKEKIEKFKSNIKDYTSESGL